MNLFYHLYFQKQFKKIPQEVKDKFYKQVAYLENNLNHPSLHAKKYDEENNIWQARVDKNFRFYFTIINDTYHLLEVKKHPK